ncbi:MAG: DedA family protein [Candidatus Kapaibacterium sp.]|nr:MAG: DedA family protein [Candidatus Kapabacteria bacterium]
METLRSLVDIFLHLDKHLGEIIGQYGTTTYAILFTIIFAETGLVVAPFLPGDSLLFAAGALAAATGVLNPVVLILLLWLAAFLGDTLNYYIGKTFGLGVLKRFPFIKPEHIEYTQKFYEKHGGKTIILARFFPIVRTFAPFVAGIGAMNYSRFLAYNIVGGLAWVASFIVLGFFFGNIPIVKRNFSLVIVGILIVSVLPGVIEFVRHRMKKSS